MQRVKWSIYFIAALGLGSIVVFLFPYAYYLYAINLGTNTQYLVLQKQLIKGQEFKLDVLVGASEHQWKKQHFSDFLLPFPYKHPQVEMCPYLEDYIPEKFFSFGVSYTDRSGKEYARVVLRKPFMFTLDLESQKLFALPVVKKMIMKIKIDKIWRDLFYKDMALFSEARGFSEVIGISYRELAYNLFIMHMRSKLIPATASVISFNQDNDTGIVELESEKKDWRKEMVYIMQEGIIYPLQIMTQRWSMEANEIRQQFYQGLSYRASSSSNADLIYAGFKALDYKDKISQVGMLYLYAAWSHVTQQQEFLRDMIQFLERGKGNDLQLAPLYQYAYKRFGTSFSSKSGSLKENQQQMLERKIVEELEQEIDAEKQKEAVNVEGDFESEERKVKYYLQQAKDRGVNTDREEDVLSE